MEKKRCYISLPISGLPIAQVKARAIKYKAHLELKGYEAITPFEICEDNKSYAHCMGEDIKCLLECHAIYLAPGWQNSKGCMAEFEVAKIYDKTILTF